MPAVMVPPVVAVMTHGAIMTDLARTVGGRHDAAARRRDNCGIIVIGIAIVIRIVVVVDAPDEEAMAVVSEPVTESVAVSVADEVGTTAEAGTAGKVADTCAT